MLLLWHCRIAFVGLPLSFCCCCYVAVASLYDVPSSSYPFGQLLYPPPLPCPLLCPCSVSVSVDCPPLRCHCGAANALLPLGVVGSITHAVFYMLLLSLPWCHCFSRAVPLMWLPCWICVATIAIANCCCSVLRIVARGLTLPLPSDVAVVVSYGPWC